MFIRKHTHTKQQQQQTNKQTNKQIKQQQQQQQHKKQQQQMKVMDDPSNLLSRIRGKALSLTYCYSERKEDTQRQYLVRY